MRTIRSGIPLLASLTLLTTVAAGQALPTQQPAYLTIYREQVKPGHVGDHVDVESGWPAAFAKAGTKETYLAVSSMTGAPEVLFLQPTASFTEAAEGMKRNDADPVLSAELARLSKADGEHLSGLSTLILMARKDLSHGQFPDIATQRFFEITTFRMQPGHDEAFEQAAKAYNAMMDRVAPGASYRVYQVIAGMQDPTFMILSSVAAYGEFDRTMADGMKAWTERTDGEKMMFAKFSEHLAFSVTNRYAVDPRMSFVPADVRARDQAFWSPAPPAKRRK
jgi:hypothetical protein